MTLVGVIALALAGIVLPASASAAWSTPKNVSNAGVSSVVPQVAVDAKGDAVFAWQRFDGSNWRVQARTRSAAGIWRPIRTISPAGQDSSAPQVAIDADGEAVLTWSRFDRSDYRVQARVHSAGGVWRPIRTISEAGLDPVYPHVAVGANGVAVLAWFRYDFFNYWMEAPSPVRRRHLAPRSNDHV